MPRHIDSFGMFKGGVEKYMDFNGFIPEDGDELEDLNYSHKGVDPEDEYWRDEWWPDFRDEAIAAATEAAAGLGEYVEKTRLDSGLVRPYPAEPRDSEAEYHEWEQFRRFGPQAKTRHLATIMCQKAIEIIRLGADPETLKLLEGAIDCIQRFDLKYRCLEELQEYRSQLKFARLETDPDSFTFLVIFALERRVSKDGWRGTFEPLAGLFEDDDTELGAARLVFLNAKRELEERWDTLGERLPMLDYEGKAPL